MPALFIFQPHIILLSIVFIETTVPP